MTLALPRRGLLAGGSAALLGAALPRRARAATPPIRIGVLTDMAGPYSEDSGRGSVTAAQLAIEDFAKIDPSLKVELTAGDMQGKPDVASALASSWYDRDAIDLIIDLPVSSAALAVAHIARQKDKVAILNPGTSDLSGKACGPNHIHWAFDTYALANSTGRAIVAGGGRSWFFVQADYAFGAALNADTSRVVEAQGGKVVGTVRYPFPQTMDFASFLLQAQSSGADVVAFANAGADAANCIKQAGEFGLTHSGQKLASLLCFIPQIHGIGLADAQGLLLTEGFYWDLNERTRALHGRLRGKTANNHAPNSVQAQAYGAAFHYLRAVAEIGAARAKASGLEAIAAMKRLPTDDDAHGAGSVRADGRKLHPTYLFQVKEPGESRGPWDYLKPVATTPAEQAFRPLAEGNCPFVRA